MGRPTRGRGNASPLQNEASGRPLGATRRSLKPTRRGINMPWEHRPSVNRFGGVNEGPDCWRTWFIEECESNKLFGLTTGHLSLVTRASATIRPYHVGTPLFLEDAPYFHKNRRLHRVCGPYIVQATDTLLGGATPVHVYDDKIIVYHDPHPESGPWLDRSVLRNMALCRLEWVNERV